MYQAAAERRVRVGSNKLTPHPDLQASKALQPSLTKAGGSAHGQAARQIYRQPTATQQNVTKGSMALAPSELASIQRMLPLVGVTYAMGHDRQPQSSSSWPEVAPKCADNSAQLPQTLYGFCLPDSIRRQCAAK